MESYLCGVWDSRTFLSNNIQRIKNTCDYRIKTKLHIHLYLHSYHLLLFTSSENKNNSSSKYTTLESSSLGSNKWQRSHAPDQLVRVQASQPWLHFKITLWGVCACLFACMCVRVCVYLNTTARITPPQILAWTGLCRSQGISSFSKASTEKD